MGNLATLLIQFSAAFLFACLADYSLAQDEIPGKGKKETCFGILTSRVTMRGHTWDRYMCTHKQKYHVIIRWNSRTVDDTIE